VHYAALEAREAAMARLLACPATRPALSHRNADELTPLHQSAGTGDARCVAALLQADSSVVDERVREEVPPCSPTHTGLQPRAPGVPSLRCGVPSLQPYASQGTSTHIACEKGHAEALRQILRHGADIEAHVSPLEDPRTPLHLASE
jgi:ankyrin repeat protein